MRLPIVLTFLLLSVLTFSQFEQDYQLLISVGEMPQRMRVDADSEARRLLLENEVGVDEVGKATYKLLKKDIVEFYSRVALGGQFYFSSGNVIYGTELNRICNQIKDDMVGDERKDEIHIFILKSSVVNAWCSGSGNIFITTEFIARMENEATLAALIGHEVNHYMSNHFRKRVIKNSSIEAWTSKNESLIQKARKNLTFDDKLKLMRENSREHETECDKYGNDKIIELGYNPVGSYLVMKHLLFSNIPLIDASPNRAYQITPEFKLPQCFFPEEMQKITGNKHYDGIYSTHPEREVRLKTYEKFKDHKEGKLYKYLTEEKFDYWKERCKFEGVHILNSNRYHSKAAFLAANLLEKYPENKYLWNEYMFALYGVAKYKLMNDLYALGQLNVRDQGHQGIWNGFIRNTDRKQLSSIILKALLKRNKESPSEFYEDLIVDLMATMKLNGKVKFEDYYPKDSAISWFEKADSWRISDEEWVNADNVERVKIRKKFKDFWKYIMYDFVDDESFDIYLKSASSIIERQKAWNDMSKEDRDEAMSEFFSKSISAQLKSKKFTILLKPEFDIIFLGKMSITPDLIETAKTRENDFGIFIHYQVEKTGLDFEFMSYRDVKEKGSTELFNRYSKFMNAYEGVQNQFNFPMVLNWGNKEEFKEKSKFLFTISDNPKIAWMHGYNKIVSNRYVLSASDVRNGYAMYNDSGFSLDKAGASTAYKSIKSFFNK